MVLSPHFFHPFTQHTCFSNRHPSRNPNAQSSAPLSGCLASLDTFVNWGQWSSYKLMFPYSQSVHSANTYGLLTMFQVLCQVFSIQRWSNIGWDFIASQGANWTEFQPHNLPGRLLWPTSLPVSLPRITSLDSFNSVPLLSWSALSRILHPKSDFVHIQPVFKNQLK